MENKLTTFFEKVNENNKIGHAYLIGNVLLDDIFDELNKILSNYFFNGSINIYEHPDIYVLKSDKKIISKSDILSVQDHIELTSQLSNYKVYIIDEAENMNSSASNSLLKTLEEPENNVIAFLITKNINLIIPTIKSRCQVILISSDSGNDELFVNKDETLSFSKLLEEKFTDLIAYENIFFDKSNLQEKFNTLINSLFSLYRCALDYMIKPNYVNEIYSKEELSFILDLNDINKITKKLIVIHDIIDMIDLNLNVGLLIDRFIIDFGRC